MNLEDEIELERLRLLIRKAIEDAQRKGCDYVVIRTEEIVQPCSEIRANSQKRLGLRLPFLHHTVHVGTELS